MHLGRCLAPVTLVALGGIAHADCPTNLRDLPPTGFIASAVRDVTGTGETARPRFEAKLGVAGGMRAEGGDGMDEANVDGSGGISGELRVHRSGVTGCASADVLDVREGSAHITASGQVPFFFAGLGGGVTVDRDITRPLSARPEFYRAPVSRIAGQFSLSFIDFELTDTMSVNQDKLRVLVMPFTVEQAVAQQDVETTAFERHTTLIETAMFRFVSRDKYGRHGDFAVFAFDADWTQPTSQTREQLTMPTVEDQTFGYVRIAPVSLQYSGIAWSFELDGGVLDLAGPLDRDSVDSTKGWFRASLGHAWERWSLEGRVERDAFIAANDLPAVENRASVTGSVESGKTRATATAFAADTHAWLDHVGGQRAGVRAGLAHELGHGFSGQLDSEYVRANATGLDAGARVMMSLAWQRATAR